MGKSANSEKSVEFLNVRNKHRAWFKKTNKIVERARKEATRAHTKASQSALARLEATTRDYIR